MTQRYGRCCQCGRTMRSEDTADYFSATSRGHTWWCGCDLTFSAVLYADTDKRKRSVR